MATRRMTMMPCAAKERVVKGSEPRSRMDASAPAPMAPSGVRMGVPAGVLASQCIVGNQAVMRMLDAHRIGDPLSEAALAVQALRDDELDDDVQRASVAVHEPSDEAIRSAAAEGVRTPSTTLPHLDRIQSSFGRHSIAHIQAHVGPEAARASRAMNALAYASGDHVVYGTTPDLRTAAHEAAHIVQQQAGVQLSGGIGRAGDPYERHADAVADAVVAGRSAEELLSRVLTGNSAYSAIQRSMTAPNFIKFTIAKQESEDKADPEWELMEYGENLRSVLKSKTFKDYFGPIQVDETKTSQIAKFTNALKNVRTLTGLKILEDAAQAVRYVWGITSTPAMRGFGTLTVSPLGGRPNFPAITQELVPIRPGQHRRHIIAWHDIREFVGLAYSSYPRAVILAIQDAHLEADSNTATAFGEAFDHVGDKPTYTSEEWLKIGLFVMNGNPRNLWAGEGSGNISINTTQMHIMNAINDAETVEDLEILAENWYNSGGTSNIYQTATQVAAALIYDAIGEALSAATDIEEEEPAMFEFIIGKLDPVLSTLKLDRWSMIPSQTETAQEKWNDLQSDITLMYRVVTGDLRVTDLKEKGTYSILKHFLRYT